MGEKWYKKEYTADRYIRNSASYYDPWCWPSMRHNSGWYPCRRRLERQSGMEDAFIRYVFDVCRSQTKDWNEIPGHLSFPYLSLTRLARLQHRYVFVLFVTLFCSYVMTRMSCVRWCYIPQKSFLCFQGKRCYRSLVEGRDLTLFSRLKLRDKIVINGDWNVWMDRYGIPILIWRLFWRMLLKWPGLPHTNCAVRMMSCKSMAIEIHYTCQLGLQALNIGIQQKIGDQEG